MELAWLGDEASGNLALVGGKAAGLGRLAARYPVPPGFCLTTVAHERWSATVPDAAAQGPPVVPALLREAVDEAYAELARRCAVARPRVAVRSSAVDEDGTAASFAGQHETYLNVDGPGEIARAVVRCWRSTHSERALAYREAQGLGRDGIRLAVLVQLLVPADVAAVVFSADPVTGDRDHVLIDASWGLGESIVGGSVTPDSYRVHKETAAVVASALGAKATMHVPADGGTREVPVPRVLRDQPALDDAQCAACASLAVALEEEIGRPVDLECAFHDHRLYLLQCRPITRLGDGGRRQAAREPADPGHARAAQEPAGPAGAARRT